MGRADDAEARREDEGTTAWVDHQHCIAVVISRLAEERDLLDFEDGDRVDDRDTGHGVGDPRRARQRDRAGIFHDRARSQRDESGAARAREFFASR